MRVARVVAAGLSNRDVERRSGVATGFLRGARQGGRRSARCAESWTRIRCFLEAWEPLLGPRRDAEVAGTRSAGTKPSKPKSRPARAKPERTRSVPEVTILESFAQFLAEERARGASVRVLDQRASIFMLFAGHLDRYAEEDGDVQGDTEEGGFAARHGPARLLDEYYMFFSYYLPRKVICSKSTIRAAGSTGAEFARWLGEKGFVDANEAAEAAETARYQARELLELEEVASEDADP